MVARQLADRARQLHNGFDDQVAIPTEHLGFARADGVTGAKISWYESRSDLRLAALPERLRGQALGQFRYRFTLDRHDGARRSPDFAEIQVAREPTSSYYLLLSDSSLVNERQPGKPPFPVANLRFVVVPSANTVPGARLLWAGPPPEVEFRSQQLLNGLAEILKLDQIRQRLNAWEDLHLTGAVGDWTVYLLATDVPAEVESRRRVRVEECRRELNLTLRIPYLEVPAR